MSRRVRIEELADRPTVSVVVPCYRYGHYLPVAVGSVLAQEGVDVDVLVIDDASPDDSADVADGLAAADDRVRVIRHQQNAGHIATYNEGLAAAQGKYVVLLSADDLLTPGALARSTALLEAHPSVGFVYGHPRSFAGLTPPPPRLQTRAWTVWPGLEWLASRYRTGRNPILSPEVVMRTSVQQAIGGYRPELPHSGDFEMWLRAAAVSDVGHVRGPDQAWYRTHPAAMHETVNAGALVDVTGRRDALSSVLRERAAAIPDAGSLEVASGRALAVEALQLACIAAERGGSVDDLIGFALEVDPEARTLRQWKGLQRRLPVSGAQDHLPWPTVRAGVRRVEGHIRWRHWRWSGV